MFIPVIGAGSIGRRHHDNLQALGVRTVLLPWRAFDPDAFRNLGADGAVIATATQVRLDLVTLCAGLGLPLYIEKPLAADVATVRAIRRALGDLAARSVVGFMMRRHPAVQHLAGRDLSGIYDASFGIGHDVRQWRKGWSFAESYAARPDGGGVLLDLCHELDLALALLKDTRVSGAASLGHDSFPGVDFATRVRIEGPGLIGSVAMDYLSPVSFRRILLRGADLVVDFDLMAGRYRIEGRRGAEHLDLTVERNELFLATMADFLHLVAGKPLEDDRLVPRLDRVGETCAEIARAWEMRVFTGQVTGDYS
jgi:predicted dehydrogenase